MQQTVYWKHLALFLFINEVQTYFDFLYICSLFEIAQGCFNGDVSERGLPARCSKASRQQPQHVPAPAPTRSAGWKPGKDSGSYCCPPDLLFLQAFLQADFAPDAEALAESNLKGFANTSMVLIETNIHQSAPCSESTSSGKDHVSPAGLDTVPRQQCQSRLAAGSLLPALPTLWGSRPGHPPSQDAAAMGPRCRR